MNWLVIAVVGAAAAWFEYNYQRSRHSKKAAGPQAPSAPAPNAPGNGAAQPSGATVPETAHVAAAGNAPSISPGDENDKKLNSPGTGRSEAKAYSRHAGRNPRGEPRAATAPEPSAS